MKNFVLLIIFMASAATAQQWDSDDLQQQVWAGRLVLDETSGEVVDLETGKEVDLGPTAYTYDSLEGMIELNPDEIFTLVGKSPQEIAEVTIAESEVEPEPTELSKLREKNKSEMGDIFEFGNL